MIWSLKRFAVIATLVMLITGAEVQSGNSTAQAATYHLTGGPVDLLLTTNASNDILSADGTFFGSTVELLGGQPGVGGGISPGGFILYNNILYPNLNPAFDSSGILLKYVSGPTLFSEGNIYGFNGTYNWFTDSGDRFGSGPLSLSEVSEVPLPGALPLFATGLGALGLLGWRRKRKQLAA